MSQCGEVVFDEERRETRQCSFTAEEGGEWCTFHKKMHERRNRVPEGQMSWLEEPPEEKKE